MSVRGAHRVSDVLRCWLLSLFGVLALVVVLRSGRPGFQRPQPDPSRGVGDAGLTGVGSAAASAPVGCRTIGTSLDGRGRAT